MKRLALELFSLVSRFVNILTGGTADLTFSARSYRDALRSEAWIDWVAFKLFGETMHCRRWWLMEVHRSERNLEAHRDLNIGLIQGKRK